MTKTALLGASALLCAIGTPAAAAPVLWTLSGVTFEDGGTASGSFSFDADTNYVTDWSISTSGGFLVPSMTYDTSESWGTGAGSIFFYGAGQQFLRLTPTLGLTDAGGVVAINTGSSYECINCSPYRYITGGSLVAQSASVPEPAAWALMLLGFGAVGVGLRSHRKARIVFA